MRNLSKVLKNRIFIFILGGLILGSAGVLVATYFPSADVTYDNSSSGLSSTDVQGAIDELYNEFSSASGFTVNMLGKKVELSLSCSLNGECPNGLYQDYDSKDRYIFRGENPNNYITFNKEKAGWRIISIESDGTIKIIRNYSIGYRQWDDSSNVWETSDLSNYLNGTYYNGLNSTAKSQIITYNWVVDVGNSSKWAGKIGLISRDEIIKSSSRGNTVDPTDTWINNSSNLWIFYGKHYSGKKAYIYNNQTGYSTFGYVDITEENGVKPALYISSDVKITGGNGTSSKPYTLG